MSYKTTEFSLGPLQLIALLLRRKVCSDCRVALERGHDREQVGLGFHDGDHTDLTQVHLLYTCPDCDRTYELRDFTEWRWSKPPNESGPAR